MMIIYLAIIDDRHQEPTAHAFSTPEKAIQFAKDYLDDFKESASHVDPKDASMSAEDLGETGWIFYAQYTTNGDSIWVVPTKIDEAE